MFVSGRVQGVGFRFETARRGRDKMLGGWVRNLPDGRVEAVFEGPRWLVEGMVEWVRHGPPGASVTGVEVTWGDPAGESGFRVR